jgi:hypothetical protein
MGQTLVRSEPMTPPRAARRRMPITVRGAERFLEELADHMTAHPDALTSGSSHCPPLLLRLAQVLHDAGRSVIRPGCARCGKIRTDLRLLRPEGGSAGPATLVRGRGPAVGAVPQRRRSSPNGLRAGSATVATASIPRLSRSAASAASSAARRYAYPMADRSAGRAGNARCTRACPAERPLPPLSSPMKGPTATCATTGNEAPPTLRKVRQAWEDCPQRSRRAARPLRQLLPGPGNHLFTLRTNTALPTDHLR